MNDVTITDGSGNSQVFSQANIVSPVFDCDGCLPAAEYVRRIAEFGLVTVENNDDGTFTYRHLSPHCICTVEFTEMC